VFQAGWVKLEADWENPSLAEQWQQLRALRQDVNRVLEKARAEKAIGASLEAKVRLYVPDTELRNLLTAMNPGDQAATDRNHVDELRYLFLVSQVEVLDSADPLQGLTYRSESDAWGIGVTDAEGEKCDRCWNYSTHIGESADHPTICDRCVGALAGTF
jgi:isoleucyl-tRNA synthetase